MLLATIALLPPAIARIDVPFMPHDSFGPNFVGLFFFAACIRLRSDNARQSSSGLAVGRAVHDCDVAAAPASEELRVLTFTGASRVNHSGA